MKDSSYKIPILIISITIIGSILFTLSMKSSWDTWVYQKSIYTDLIGLVGEISAKSEDMEELKRLKTEFDQYYGGEMIFAEKGDSELLTRMMILRKDYENHLQGRSDYYRTDKLKQSCKKLIDQLRVAIDSGDSRNRLNMFIPLLIGVFILLSYFSFNTLVKKSRKKIRKDNLPLELIAEIKTLIGNARIAEALNKLELVLEEKKSSKLDELLMIKAQFNNTVKDRNLDLIDVKEERQANSKTNKAILDLLNDLS